MIKSIIAAIIAAASIAVGCVIYFQSAPKEKQTETTEETAAETTAETTDETTAGTTADTTVPETAPETVPETAPETVPETAPETAPPETVPSADGGEYLGSLYTRAQLEALDNTKRGYGPGVAAGADKRPYGAVGAQETFGGYGAVFIAPDDGNIHLTFDEGYENGYTGQILDTLAAKGVKAIFFVTMQYCKSNGDLVRRMIDEGHTLGNHSVSHKSMPTLSLDEMYNEIMQLHWYIWDNYGYSMKLFRPPMGEYSERVLALVQSCGYKSVQWSFAYYDYDVNKQPDETEALERVTGAAHSGAVYLLHAVSRTNTAILPAVIDNFRERGFNLAAFTE